MHREAGDRELARKPFGERLKAEVSLQLQQVLAPRCIAVTAVLVHEFRADVQLPCHRRPGVVATGLRLLSAAIRENEDGKAGWKIPAGYDPAGAGGLSGGPCRIACSSGQFLARPSRDVLRGIPPSV